MIITSYNRELNQARVEFYEREEELLYYKLFSTEQCSFILAQSDNIPVKTELVMPGHPLRVLHVSSKFSVSNVLDGVTRR